MGNFPYNTQKYDGPAETVNGCPLTYSEAFGIAHKVRLWHGCIADTSDWTQSSDGGYDEEIKLTFGLMELLSDPGAVQRIITVGGVVRETVARLLNSDIESEFFVNARDVVKPLFEKE